MPAPGDNKNYVLGSGRIFLDLFEPGTNTPTGELYLGNTPELSTTMAEEVLDHFDADEGLRVKDDSVSIESNLTGAFTTDHISVANVAFFFGGDINAITITESVGVTDTFTVTRGRNYQLGTSEDFPQGARNVTLTSLTKPGTPDPVVITAAGNYEFDGPLGRFYIESDAPDIEDGDVLTATFTIAAGLRTFIVARGQNLYGALRFIANNQKGTNKDHFWPRVKLTPNGDYALKGSEWQQLGFSFEALKRDAATQRAYIDAR